MQYANNKGADQTTHANNKGADLPAHPQSLISASVVRCLDPIIPILLNP